MWESKAELHLVNMYWNKLKFDNRESKDEVL